MLSLKIISQVRRTNEKLETSYVRCYSLPVGTVDVPVTVTSMPVVSPLLGTIPATVTLTPDFGILPG